MARVIRIDGVDGGSRLLHCGYGEQAFPRGQDVREARVLRDNRFAARQIARVALAEPSASQTNVLILGDSELAPRMSEVLLVGAEYVQRHREGRNDLPAAVSELGPV